MAASLKLLSGAGRRDPAAAHEQVRLFFSTLSETDFLSIGSQILCRARRALGTNFPEATLSGAKTREIFLLSGFSRQTRDRKRAGCKLPSTLRRAASGEETW